MGLQTRSGWPIHTKNDRKRAIPPNVSFFSQNPAGKFPISGQGEPVESAPDFGQERCFSVR